jgi:hypothetical protein
MTDSENKNEECIKLFCDTLAELNAVSLKQMEGLLDIAVKAAQAADSGSSADDTARFVDELKITFQAVKQTAQEQEAKISEQIKNDFSNESKQSFCETVEEKLTAALENSLSHQQQLNVLGEAILAKAATLLLSPPETESNPS